MIVNIIEPKKGTLLDPACGSGGMFIQSGDFINSHGMSANNAMTFFGQEKVEYNAQLCLMNMAVHGLNGKIKSGDEANSFYRDAHNLVGSCDYVMANPPFNVDKVKAESCESAGRLPFGMPTINQNKEVGNGNYLWISYFYSYLNERGRAGFVMASSATDSQGKDKDIRQQLVETGHVDVMISVGNNFFYTKSLPCSLWFFDKGKREELKDKVLFIDARNYYTVVDRTLNEWSEWQMKNLNAIVWLYRGEQDKYTNLLNDYTRFIESEIRNVLRHDCEIGQDVDEKYFSRFASNLDNLMKKWSDMRSLTDYYPLSDELDELLTILDEQVKDWQNDIENLDKNAKKALYQKVQLRTFNQYKKVKLHQVDQFKKEVADLKLVISEAKWLTDKFGMREYQDVAGLCKMASSEEIAEKNYSLTPGAYVGVAEVEDDGIDFAERMAEIHRELLDLQVESNVLMATISKNMKEMGL